MSSHVEQAVKAMSPRGKDAPKHSTGRAPRNESRDFQQAVKRECRLPRTRFSPDSRGGQPGTGTPGKILKSRWKLAGKPGPLKAFAKVMNESFTWLAGKKDSGAAARKLRHAKAQAGRKPKSSSGPKPKKEKKGKREPGITV